MNTISIVGYGSLLSEASARETVPHLSDFRLTRVAGYKRIFNKVGIIFVRRDGMDEGARLIASCATRRDPAHTIICSLFEVDEAGFEELREREHRLRWTEVDCTTGDGIVRGHMCTEYNDSDYRLNKCISAGDYHRRVGQYYSGKIWRDDILPYPPYLKHCLHAAQGHGDAVLYNYLETTFLADGVTTIGDYIDGRKIYQDWFEGLYTYAQD